METEHWYCGSGTGKPAGHTLFYDVRAIFRCWLLLVVLYVHMERLILEFKGHPRSSEVSIHTAYNLQGRAAGPHIVGLLRVYWRISPSDRARHFVTWEKIVRHL